MDVYKLSMEVRQNVKNLQILSAPLLKVHDMINNKVEVP